MKRFAMVPLDVFKLDLTARALRVLGALIAHANQEGVCWPTDRAIAESVDLRKENIHFPLSELESAGILSREGGRRKRVIRLNLERFNQSSTTVISQSPATDKRTRITPNQSSTTDANPQSVVHDCNESVAGDCFNQSSTTVQSVVHDCSVESPATVSIRTDQEQIQEGKAGNAPTRTYAREKGQGAGVAAASRGPDPDSRNPEPAPPAGTSPPISAPPPPGLADKIHRLGGEHLDGSRAEAPAPRVPPGVLAEIARDCQRDGLGFWAERLIGLGCPADWLAPLFRSFWCRRGSGLPRTFRPLELRLGDWQAAGSPLREHLAEADIKALEDREQEAASARQWEEYERLKQGVSHP